MSLTSCIGLSYANRNKSAIGSTIFGFARHVASRQSRSVFGQQELLAALHREREAGNIRNRDVEKLLRLPSSRVTEIFDGKRQIRLDEAKRLVEAFDLEEVDSSPHLHEQAARLFLRHAAKVLGAEAPPAQVHALAQDLQGFVEFATGPEVRDQIESAQEFFLGRLPGQRPSESEAS